MVPVTQHLIYLFHSGFFCLLLLIDIFLVRAIRTDVSCTQSVQFTASRQFWHYFPTLSLYHVFSSLIYDARTDGSICADLFSMRDHVRHMHFSSRFKD